MSTAYVAMRDRLLVCEGERGDPTGWTATSRLEGRDPECVAASPDAPERVFVGTFEAGLFRSADGGESFERLGTDFESDAVLSLAVSPHDPDVVYAGTEPSRIYRSPDGGDSWEHLDGLVDLPSADEWFFPPRPHTHHVRWIEVDPADPDRLYVGIEAGAFVLSTDGGESWRERPPGSRRDNHSLATHRDREGRVYAAAGDGFALSDDGGETWGRPQEGLEHRYCWSVVPDPGDPGRILVSSARGASRAHRAGSAESHVYRREAGGPWERLDGRDPSTDGRDDRGLPTGEGVVRTVFDATGEAGVVYAVNNRGAFVTDDFGDSWDRLGIEWEEAFEAETPNGMVAIG